MRRQELLNLKDRIEELEREVARDEGSLEQMLKDLKAEGHDSVAMAATHLGKLKDDLMKMEADLKSQVTKIQSMMEEWE